MQCTCHKVLVRGMQTYQSGERMTGSHEVSGSIPLISTTGKPGKLVLMKVKTSFFLFLLFGRLTYLRLPVLRFPLTGVPSGMPVFLCPDIRRLTIKSCRNQSSCGQEAYAEGVPKGTPPFYFFPDCHLTDSIYVAREVQPCF